MGKPGAVRQKEYEARQRSVDVEKFLKKQREKKRLQRQRLKTDGKKYEATLKKDRERKRLKSRDQTASTSADSSFLSRQSLGKAIKRITEKIPKSPGKKKEVLTKIIATLSP